MKKITKDTSLIDLLGNPKVEEILARHNLPCLTCPFAGQEMANLKLGDVCKIYNIDLEKLLKDLNKTNKK
jgi:hypothetical protein